MTLYCVTCGRGKTITGTGELPPCKTCGPTTWKSADQPNDQKYPYVITGNDRRFLRSLRIDPEAA